MKPVMSYYYVTIRCNSRCKYCNFWNRETTEEPTIKQLEENIKSLRKLGVKYIDFTGGEPFLYPHLQEALRIAKENRLITAITSNGISYKPIEGLDYLQFSLDYPDKRHDKVRGVPCFSKVINSIEKAKDAGQNVGVCWTVTNENIGEIDNMIALCKRYNIILGINYLYSYFGNESIDYEHARKLKSYFKNPNATSDYAALSFIKHGGNNPSKPICRAMSSVIVITADNKYCTPCFQFSNEFEPIVDLEKQFKEKDKSMEGKHSFCDKCTMWCYLKPSFLYHPFSRYFYLYLYDLSRSYFKRK